jgi:hypothetical protein
VEVALFGFVMKYRPSPWEKDKRMRPDKVGKFINAEKVKVSDTTMSNRISIAGYKN